MTADKPAKTHRHEPMYDGKTYTPEVEDGKKRKKNHGI